MFGFKFVDTFWGLDLGPKKLIRSLSYMQKGQKCIQIL